MKLPTDQQQDLLRFAYDTAIEAGEIALRFFRKPTGVMNKAGGDAFDPVTEADREVERHLRAAITQRFSDHAIVGEEFANTHGKSDFTWVIDPIDGTRAFISGVPAWGILLGLCWQGRPMFGLMHQPYTGETFIGLQDKEPAAWFMRNQFDLQNPLLASTVKTLDDAVLYSTHPDLFDSSPAGEFERFRRVADACKLLRYGGDCYSYCLLAMGQIDLVIESGLQSYDILPLLPIVEAAGGFVTDWQGQPLSGGGSVVAAAGPELHAQALELLQGPL